MLGDMSVEDEENKCCNNADDKMDMLSYHLKVAVGEFLVANVSGVT